MSSIDILTDSAVYTFAEVAFANRRRLRRVWLISPWLSPSPGKYDFLSLIVEAAKTAGSQLTLLTRPPGDAWHKNAINILSAVPRPLVFYHPDLHAKLYLLECDGFRYAMLGSPNLTKRGQSENRELAVEFRSTAFQAADKVSSMISELKSYAIWLLSDDDTELAE